MMGKEIIELLRGIHSEYIFATVTAFSITAMLIPIVIQFSEKYNLMDKPGDRKAHKKPTPALGGVAIFIGFVISMIIWIENIDGNILKYLISATVLIFLVGIYDDIKEISPKKKFIFQLLAAIIISSGGIRLESLYGIFGIEELPIVAQYLITWLIVVGITNAYNLLDGIDGLAGGIGIINFSVLFIGFLIAGTFNYSILITALLGAIFGFLVFNFNPASIFMGDSGSLLLGFIMVSLGLHLIQIQPVENNNILPIVYGVFILPVFDTLRVFALRMWKGKSPFSADRNHFHHLLIKTGYDHKKSAFILYMANLSLITFSWLISQLNLNIHAELLIITSVAIVLSEMLSIKKFRINKSLFQTLSEQKSKRLMKNHLLHRLNQEK